MKQQINLLEQMKKPARVSLSFKRIIVFSVVFVVILLLVAFFQLWVNITLHRQLYALNKQAVKLADNVLNLKRRYPEESKDDALEKKVLAMAADIERKNQILYVLKQNGELNIDGFSRYFMSFSDVTGQGVWLNRFTFEQGGSDVKLEGSAYQSDAVLDYSQRLSNLPLFKSTSFLVKEVSAAKQKTSPIHFRLVWNKLGGAND